MRKLYPYSLLTIACFVCSFVDKDTNAPMGPFSIYANNQFSLPLMGMLSFPNKEILADNRIAHFYPNPATTVINFTFDKTPDKIYTLQIYNFIGRKMNEQKITTNKLTIQLDDQYFRGLYIYQLMDINGKIVESGKFQVSK